MKMNVDPLLDAIDLYIAKADDDLENTLIEEGYVAAGVAVSHISDIEDGISAAIQNKVDEILVRIQNATDVNNFINDVWPDIVSADELERALHDIFNQQFDNLFHQFTKQWIISVDPELGEIVDNNITKPAEAFIKGWSQQLANIMQLNTKDGIEKRLLEAQKQNQTIDEVAQAIADSGIRECGYRSRRTAVTEVLRVEEYAHQEARIQNPLCYKKEWAHTGAAHPRENHVAISGQQVFKRETFTLVGNPCVYYSAADMQKILKKSMEFVTYNTTYCNSLFVWLDNLSKASEMANLVYGIEIPEEYQSVVLADFAKAGVSII